VFDPLINLSPRFRLWGREGRCISCLGRNSSGAVLRCNLGVPKTCLVWLKHLVFGIGALFCISCTCQKPVNPIAWSNVTTLRVMLRISWFQTWWNWIDTRRLAILLGHMVTITSYNIYNLSITYYCITLYNHSTIWGYFRRFSRHLVNHLGVPAAIAEHRGELSARVEPETPRVSQH
jgi:hypothetical protein